jgi:methyl-accepting chemotaxis protein
MSDMPEQDEARSDQSPSNNARVMVVIGMILMIVGLLIVGAVMLAINAKTAAPSVRVVRDLLVILMSLEVVIIGAAFTIFLLQLARLINLVRNEIEPLVEAVSETVNTVRGTALFISKNVVEPVTNVTSVVRGLGKVAGDVDAIRRAAGIVVEVANAASTTSASGSSRDDDNDEDLHNEESEKRRPRRKTGRGKK